MQKHIVPIVIGIVGGSGSGKTTVANRILKQVGAERIAFLPHDAYYRDLENMPIEERVKVNFDHPDALESELMVQHILQLKKGNHVDLPVYDFTTYTRSGSFLRVEPQPVILVEGILLFAEPELRKLFDMKIFVDTDPDIRFIRRLQRDLIERGRKTENIISQYLNTVRPMHLEFVEPSKRFANVIIPEGGMNEVAMEMVVVRIESLLN